ncbi:MAG: response regulator [Bdellovibrionaceae bacterium]|nr:response regulator [Pseudobdellovibrionaceae bacterium]
MFASTTKVLIVDDMSTMRKLVLKACNQLGLVNVEQAEDGVKAWEKIAASPEPFGLIISDWNMPNCTGIDLLKRVRSTANTKDTPFVLLTAERDTAQVKEAVEAGVDNYIVKPFNQETFAEKIGTVFQKRFGKTG